MIIMFMDRTESENRPLEIRLELEQSFVKPVWDNFNDLIRFESHNVKNSFSIGLETVHACLSVRWTTTGTDDVVSEIF